MPLAIEHIRRMRGGAQAHLMRCEDECYYVVKFQNNPQGSRVLVNELLGTRLAARMGLSVPVAAVVEVRAELVNLTEELTVQLGRGRSPCAPGLQFGSRYPGSPARTAVYDFLPDEQLRAAENLSEFAGMLVFDKWTCNTNGRQAVFVRPETDGGAPYRAIFIDQGFCFNAGEWNFPDGPLRGIYMRSAAYENVRGWADFEPWMERAQRISEEMLDEISSEIPPEWYDFDPDALYRMLEQLLRRTRLLPELIESARKSSRVPFPNWR